MTNRFGSGLTNGFPQEVPVLRFEVGKVSCQILVVLGMASLLPNGLCFDDNVQLLRMTKEWIFGGLVFLYVGSLSQVRTLKLS